MTNIPLWPQVRLTEWSEAPDGSMTAHLFTEHIGKLFDSPMHISKDEKEQGRLFALAQDKSKEAMRVLKEHIDAKET